MSRFQLRNSETGENSPNVGAFGADMPSYHTALHHEMQTVGENHLPECRDSENPVPLRQVAGNWQAVQRQCANDLSGRTDASSPIALSSRTAHAAEPPPSDSATKNDAICPLQQTESARRRVHDGEASAGFREQLGVMKKAKLDFDETAVSAFRCFFTLMRSLRSSQKSCVWA